MKRLKCVSSCVPAISGTAQYKKQAMENLPQMLLKQILIQLTNNNNKKNCAAHNLGYINGIFSMRP